MNPFSSLIDAITRRRQVDASIWRGRNLCICHVAHPNDRLSSQNQATYYKQLGIDTHIVEFNPTGQRPELQRCLTTDTAAILGYNSQLDHSWIGDERFVALASRMNIPVIHCILDHPCLRWPEFQHNLDASNARYVLQTRYSEQYFQRYCKPGAATAVASLTMSPFSRVDGMSRDSFLARDIACMIPLNLRRISGTADEMETKIQGMGPQLADAVRDAIDDARFDLENALVIHLEAALARRGIDLPNESMHACTAIVEDMTSIWRRRRIFEVASRFPVLIQTDFPPPELTSSAVAEFRTTIEWTDATATAARMKNSRAVVSVGVNDAVHDRTGNAVNAGCVAVVEDNRAHRKWFKSGKNALLFRYDDDSLDRCLDLVCHRAELAYEIAASGMSLRDNPSFRYSGVYDLLALARR